MIQIAVAEGQLPLAIQQFSHLLDQELAVSDAGERIVVSFCGEFLLTLLLFGDILNDMGIRFLTLPFHQTCRDAVKAVKGIFCFPDPFICLLTLKGVCIFFGKMPDTQRIEFIG